MTGYGPPEQQPYGQQPQYGQQPGYVQPAAPGQVPGQPAPGAPVNPYVMGTRDARSPGVVGIVLAIIAAAALVVSFTAVKWLSDTGKGKFSNIHDLLSTNGIDPAGLSKAYFGWLAWVLAAVAVVFAIIANLPTPASAAFRAIGALVGVAGIVVTFFAIKFAKHGPSYSQYLKHAQVGFYLALGGFLVAAIASLIGPRRAVVV